MKTYMDDSRIENLSELVAFVKGLGKTELRVESILERYILIKTTVEKFGYSTLRKRDKHIVYLYLRRLTGYHKAQLLRLIKRVVSEGKLAKKPYVRKNPNVIYTQADLKLLETTDLVHCRLNSLATKEILRRMSEVYHKTEYDHVSGVSSSHINNLRRDPHYKSFWVNGTKSVERSIVETREPEPNGKPGSIRVDTVHQREIYYLNLVDEITQWEIMIAVPMLSERYLLPALKLAISQFPFKIFNFHSDRGSEFINHIVAELLEKLRIEQTKSRSRHSNDNALVESKNGSVIRKNFGYAHIHKNQVDSINQFIIHFFNPYLNYHRPCLYPTRERIDKYGKTRVVYDEAKVPYDKLQEITGRKVNTLKEGVTWEQLDQIAIAYSDNDFAKLMRKQEHYAYDTLIDLITRKEA
jgi:hypothetical protein